MPADTSKKDAILPSGYSARKLQIWSNGQPSCVAWQETSFTVRKFVVITQREAEKKILRLKEDILLSEFLD